MKMALALFVLFLFVLFLTACAAVPNPDDPAQLSPYAACTVAALRVDKMGITHEDCIYWKFGPSRWQRATWIVNHGRG